MDCSSIFEDYISNCNVEIEVYANFDPSTLLKWVITAPNGNEYYGENTTEPVTGILKIPISELPAGLLNQYGGTFMLQFFDTPYQSRKVNFNIAKEYDTIAFTVKAGTNQKPNLGSFKNT